MYTQVTTEDFEACTNRAFLTTSNCGGIEIAISEDGLIAYADHYMDSVTYSKQWQEIKYTSKGRPFFYYHGAKRYIDDFLKRVSAS